MARTPRPRPIVAELGRPETAAETAARKARDSRLYRQRKTVNNLVLSLIVSLGLVLVIVLAVPRGTGGWESHSVDAGAAARAAGASTGLPLVAPEVPETWLAKQAEIRTGSDGTEFWYIGYTTDSEAFAAIAQADTVLAAPASNAWVSQQLEGLEPTGTETLAGHAWTIYDYPERDADSSNVRFAAETELAGLTTLVYGTDSAAVLRTLTAALTTAVLTESDPEQLTPSEES